MRKVFVVSLHRCATQSTDLLLKNAGLRTCHFPSTVDGIGYEMQCLGFETNPAKIAEILRPVFDAFDSVSDAPIPSLYEALEEAYPDARFVAVRRDPKGWLRSVRRHTRGRDLCIYERAQYWRYLPDKPMQLDEVSDDALLDVYRRHYDGLVAHFAGRQNFILVELDDHQIAQKLASFLNLTGIDTTAFPRYDYEALNTLSSRYRFHVLGIPHTISIRAYNMDAFTQKVVRMCAMLKRRGHYVIHYGHEDSRVECDEHVTVTKRYDIAKAYGDHNWRNDGVPNYRVEDHAYQTFYAKSISAIEKRKRRGDFLLCMSCDHKRVAEAHKDMIVCEPGIGYPNGHFAPFKVFESYALLHAYFGLPAVMAHTNDFWYHAVIPNYFDLSEFEFCTEKDDYFLFLGRVNVGKGYHIAIQAVEAVGGRLIIAGAGGPIEGVGTRTKRPVGEYVEQVGAVDVDTRKRLLAKAKAVILPSMFIEPFCGVQVEAMLSGTPVITTDWGAFAEYNLHGITGYRCRTFEHFVWAAENIGNISPRQCREWAAANFSMERVGEMFDEYFFGVRNIFDGAGWYQDYPGRTQLDWLSRRWPAAAQPEIPAQRKAEWADFRV